MTDMSDAEGFALDLQSYWVVSRRFRALKKNEKLNAILLDDMAYEMRFVLKNTKDSGLRRFVSALLGEMMGARSDSASVGA